MSKWTEVAIRIQSIAQAGLAYGENEYDRERYEELRKIAAEMISYETEIPVEKVTAFFCNETGYQTPKVDTRAAVFENGKILLGCGPVGGIECNKRDNGRSRTLCNSR